MIIKLLESIPKLSNEEIQSWSQLNRDNPKESSAKQYALVDDVIKRFNNAKLLNLAPSLFHSFEVYSPNPLYNPFYEFLDNLGKTKVNFNNHEKLNEFLISLIDINNKEGISFNNKYFLLPSLYERNNLREFNYTVRLLDAVNNSYKMSRLLKNPSVVKIKELFVDNNINNDLKPVGEGDNSDNTLFGVVSRWAGKNGENEKGAKDSNSNKVKVKLSISKLKDIKKKYQYTTLDQIKADPKENKEGNVVYAMMPKTKRDKLKLNDLSSGAFYQYKNGEWVKYENEATNVVLKG